MKGSHKKKKNSKKTVRKRKYKGGNKYTAVIIEPRKHKALEYVLTNFLENLDNSWDILIFHGNLNKEYIENIINTKLNKYRTRISLLSLEKDNITIDEYNILLTSKDFYNKIPTETFLIFQTDTLINPRNKDNINKFLEYDYVGAPWSMNREAGEVGNGGLSLRKKSKMLEILNNVNNELKSSENIFLSLNASKKVNIKKPSKEEAQLFSSETIWNPKSFGVHASWKYNDKTIILKDFQELEKLIQLQDIEPQNGGNKKKHYKCVILIIDHTHILNDTITVEYKRNNTFKDTWKKYINNDPDILGLFICADDKLENNKYKLDLDNNILYTSGKECVTPCGTKKTLLAMKYVKDNYDFDFILRTNLSSFYVLPKLKNTLNTLDKENIFTGYNKGSFVSGTQMIFSKDTIKILTNSINEIINKYNTTDGMHNDDVAISDFLKNKNIKLGSLDSVYEFIDKNTNNSSINNRIIDSDKDNIFMYRVKNIDNLTNNLGSKIDMNIFNKLYEYYYNKKSGGNKLKLCFIIACRVLKNYKSYIDFTIKNINELYPDSTILLVDNNSKYSEYFDQFKNIKNIIYLLNNSESKYELGAYNFAIEHIKKNNLQFDYYTCLQDLVIPVNKYDYNKLLKENINAMCIYRFHNDKLCMYNDSSCSYHKDFLKSKNISDIDDFKGCTYHSFIINHKHILKLNELTKDLIIKERKQSEGTERILAKLISIFNNNYDMSVDGFYEDIKYDVKTVDPKSEETKKLGYHFIKVSQGKNNNTKEL